MIKRKFNEWINKHGVEFKNQAEYKGGLKVFEAFHTFGTPEVVEANKKIRETIERLEELKNHYEVKQ